MFLGTGLGPRSYSIIEQGMISRLIEAKPEDMRAHLEEAAGISKYKERRRETETRIRHTRDNLDRLNDLREEIDNQLKNLQKQAKAAERHRVLVDELRRVDAELLAIKLRPWMRKPTVNARNLSASRLNSSLLSRLSARLKRILRRFARNRFLSAMNSARLRLGTIPLIWKFRISSRPLNTTVQRGNDRNWICRRPRTNWMHWARKSMSTKPSSVIWTRILRNLRPTWTPFGRLPRCPRTAGGKRAGACPLA